MRYASQLHKDKLAPASFFLFWEDDLSPLSDIEKQKILNKIVEELTQFRKVIGTSQTEMGNKIGLSRQSISAVERGCVRYHGVYFLQLCL